MIMTKKEAKQKGVECGTICECDDCNHRDQRSSEECPHCIFIEDACGCDEDMSCEQCDPDGSFKVRE